MNHRLEIPHLLKYNDAFFSNRKSVFRKEIKHILVNSSQNLK